MTQYSSNQEKKVALKVAFAELKQSINYGVEEENIDPDLASDLLEDVSELEELIFGLLP